MGVTFFNDNNIEVFFLIVMWLNASVFSFMTPGFSVLIRKAFPFQNYISTHPYFLTELPWFY